MWCLCMFAYHDKLFRANEPLESRVVSIIRISRGDLRYTPMPDNIPSPWKQFLHQLILAGDFHVDMPISETTGTSALTVVIVALNGICRVCQGEEFNKRIHSLRG